MRIIFFGSDDFAAEHLEKLLASNHQVVACVTQPDRAKGRGLHVAESMIKELAKTRAIPLFQPEAMKDAAFTNALKNLESDLFVVVAYGKILPEEILSIPKIFCINVHGSLLPQYRGAAPINWAIINGDAATGVTVIKMNAGMDAGDIIAQTRIAIGAELNSAELRSQMAKLGAGFLVKTVEDIREGTFKLSKQDLAKVSHAPKLTKELGAIDWNLPAERIHNLIRGLQPWPGAYTTYVGTRHAVPLLLKILASRVVAIDRQNHPAGQIVSMTPDGFVVVCGQDGLLVKRVHPESAKAMDAKSFVAGHKVTLDSRLV